MDPESANKLATDGIVKILMSDGDYPAQAAFINSLKKDPLEKEVPPKE